jgi:hypothetical protein
MTAPNPASILDSVKKVLGLDPDFTDFDLDITMHTNTFFVNLQQLGAGPVEGFTISDNTALWTDFSEHPMLQANIQSWMYLKVKMVFDPPSLSFVIQAQNELALELEGRINLMAEAINPPSDPFTGKPTTTPVGIIN